MLKMIIGLSLSIFLVSTAQSSSREHYFYLPGDYGVSSGYAVRPPVYVPSERLKVHEPMYVPYELVKVGNFFAEDPSLQWVVELVVDSLNASQEWTTTSQECYRYETTRAKGLKYDSWGDRVANFGRMLVSADCDGEYVHNRFYNINPFNSKIMSCPAGYQPVGNEYPAECGPKLQCQCDENLEDGQCIAMEVETSIDWLESLLYEYPNNNHDHAPRCEPLQLEEIDACPTDDNSTLSGNPIDCATGRKVQTETDYRGHGLDPITFQRTYRSPEPKGHGESASGSQLPVWSNAAIPHFSLWTFDDSSQLAVVTVGERYRRAFYRKHSDLAWQANPHLPTVSIEPHSGGLLITTQHSQSYQFDLTGKVLQSLNREQPRYEYQHFDIDGHRQVQVRNRSGDSLTFAYDGLDGPLSRITDQNGVSIHYRYDDLGNLIEVIYPNGTPDDLADNPRKTYLYENPALPYHLTGIVDQNGERYATFTYDEDGRAIRTEHADGAGRVEVQYPADGEAIVRFYQDSQAEIYREERYTYGRFRGAYRLTSKTVTLCQGCATGTETWDYNAEGLLERHTTPGGQTTVWSYDDQGRKLTETIAVGTPEARITRYHWNNDWNKLESVETETDITTHVYDDRGNRITTSVTPRD